MFRQSFTGSALLSSLWFDSSTGLSPPSVQLSSCVLLSPHNLLGSSAFARHYSRNNFYSLFLQVLRCFSSPGYHPDYSEYYVFNIVGSPIQTSADQCSFATPHSFSQLTTSFVVSKSLGIPRTPLFASFLLRLHYYLL